MLNRLKQAVTDECLFNTLFSTNDKHHDDDGNAISIHHLIKDPVSVSIQLTIMQYAQLTQL
ncbi:hypothetical protein Pgy4_34996, partial [Pseudomonas savastanoi pv. glycinea str. race 4]